MFKNHSMDLNIQKMQKTHFFSIMRKIFIKLFYNFFKKVDKDDKGVVKVYPILRKHIDKNDNTNIYTKK